MMEGHLIPFLLAHRLAIILTNELALELMIGLAPILANRAWIYHGYIKNMKGLCKEM